MHKWVIEKLDTTILCFIRAILKMGEENEQIKRQYIKTFFNILKVQAK